MRKNIGSVIVSVLVAFVLFSGVVWAPAEERRLTPGTVKGDLAIEGNTTVGDAVGDTATCNAGTWNWPNVTSLNFNAAITFDATGQIPLMKALTWDYRTSTTNFLVPDADAATEAMNRQVSDVRYPQLAALNTFTKVNLFPDGTSTDPSIAFASETGTGFYLSKVGKIGLGINGSGLVTTFDAVKGIDTVGSGTFGTDLTVGGTTILGDANSDGLTFKSDTVNWTSTNDIHNVYSSDALFTGASVMRFVTSFQIKGGLDVEGTDGIGIFPGSDIDTNIFIVGVTGSPKAFWDESEDKVSFTKGIIQPDSKAGSVAGASFAGNPKVFTVTFGTAFPNTNYSISITSAENRTWTYNTKLAASFIINSNANLAFTGDVDWTVTVHSDP